MQSPTDPRRETTLEEPSVVRTEDRERIFGHSDHVRVYGRVYKDGLEGAGFVVRQDSYAREPAAELVRVYGLKRASVVWFCARPRAEHCLAGRRRSRSEVGVMAASGGRPLTECGERGMDELCDAAED